MKDDITYGDMLNILLSLLFPASPPTPRNSRVKQVICFYNPNVPRVASKLFSFLETLGADKKFLETLKKELSKSLDWDRRIGCIPVYK